MQDDTAIPSKTISAADANATDPNAKTDDRPKPAPLAPTEYQKRLMAQWYETGHQGPAPFTTNTEGSQLQWMNRKQRRAIASSFRKRNK